MILSSISITISLYYYQLCRILAYLICVCKLNSGRAQYGTSQYDHHDLWCFDLKTKLWQEIEIEDKNGSVV